MFRNFTKFFTILFVCNIFTQSQLLATEKSYPQKVKEAPFASLTDPAPQYDRHIEYRRIGAEIIDSKFSQEKSEYHFTVKPMVHNAFIGQMVFHLNRNIATGSSIPQFKIYTKNIAQQPELIALGSFDNDGQATVTFHGDRSDEYEIFISNVSGSSSPIEGILVNEIIESNSKKIMLMGDSITYGKLAENLIGYRHFLYDKLIDNGFDIEFVGDFGDYPYRGHYQGGERIGAFIPRSLGGSGDMDVTNPMNYWQPNIAAIHLGTNDINNSAPAGPFQVDGEYTQTIGGATAQLIDYLLSWNNGTMGTNLEQIIVSLIIPAKYLDSMVYKANEEIAKVVTAFNSGQITGKPEPVILCDHFTPFYEYPGFLESYYKNLMGDKLHPTTTGHQLMAETYYKTFEQVLTGQKPWFSNISWETGITGPDVIHQYQGISAIDLNADTLEDLYIARASSEFPGLNDLYFEESNQSPFINKAFEYNINDPGLSRNGLFVDIDNDGDMDLFNTQYGKPNRIYEQRANHQFVDISNQAGIDNRYGSTSIGLAFDCENDGDIDLLAINSREQNEFYINNGFGNFEFADHGLLEGAENDIASSAATAVDFDNDGDIDIYVVKRYGPNRLFVNDGNGNFSEQAQSAGIAINDNCNGATWADLDNNGFLDVAVTTTQSGTSHAPLYLFKNNGDGTFQEMSPGIDIPNDGYSAIISDFDNDGWQDIVTTNETSLGQYFQNSGNWSFSLVQKTGAEINGGDTRGATWFDYENDGDIDIVAARKDIFNVFLRNNLNNGNNYLKVSAIGPSGDAAGFGTKIWLYQSNSLGNTEALIGYREILAINGYLSQPSPVQHFGLGNFASCDLLAVFTDGTYIIERNVSANQRLEISTSMVAQNYLPNSLIIFDGNAQADTVGKELAKPIEVQVVDEQNRGVANIPIDFQILSGDATLFEPTTTSNTIWIEAESGILENTMRWAYDQSTSGDGVIFIPSFGQGAGSATIEITAEPGNYYGWLRVNNPQYSGQLDVELPGESNSSQTVELTDSWEWIPLAEANSTKRIFSLSSTHTLKISTTIAGLQIDKFVFSADADFTPVGLGEQGGTSLNTDREGIARRFVQLGPTAGQIIVSATAQFEGGLAENKTVQLSLKSLPAKASDITATSGNNQTGLPEQPLADPLIVTVFDPFGNPTPNLGVLFEPLVGGTVNPATPVFTDTLGAVSATFTPDRSGSLQNVRAGLVNSPQINTTFTINVQGVADKLELVSGDEQEATVGDSLQNPISVKLLTESGQPAENYTVLFTTLNINGKLSDNNNFTDADSSINISTNQDGIATVYWKLGTQSGQQQMTVNAGAISNSPKIITATAHPGAGSQLLVLSGNNQTGQIQQDLPIPFQVRLLDQFSNPVPSMDITFESIRGGGTFSGSDSIVVKTDSSGNAQAPFSLGTIAGTDIYVAQVFTIVDSQTVPATPVQFTASALPGPAKLAGIVSGNNQVATVNTQLPNPLVLQITDNFANPVSEYELTFDVSQGNGTIDGSSSFKTKTNEAGQAEAVFVLGEKAGQNVVRTDLPDLQPNSLEFMATGLADNPIAIIQVSGNDQTGPKNRPLVEPFVVKIQDQFENPITNHPVSFAVQSELGLFGTSSSVTVSTDSLGQASATMTLGSELGDSNYVAHATSSFNGTALQNSPVVFIASGIMGDPAKLVGLTDKFQIGAANKPLQDSISVRVEDEDGLPIDGHEVKFEIISGDGILQPGESNAITQQTDSRGIASVAWILGSASQEHALQVISTFMENNLANSPMEFKATAVNTNASSISLVSGNEQTGQAGLELENPLIVQVKDNLNFPVANHPVKFSSEYGKFKETESDEFIVNTNALGYAEAHFILGGLVGTKAQSVIVRSSNAGGIELEKSPLTFEFTANPGPFDPDSSGLFATSPIPANGIATATISVFLRDAFGNPIPNREIEIVGLNHNADISPATGITNETGIFTSFAKSNQAGELIVEANEVASGEKINGRVSVQFIETDASKAEKVVAENVLYPASALRDDLAVRITNPENAGVEDFPVTFFPLSNNITIYTPQPTFSDTDGLAKTTVVAKNEIGTAEVLAVSPGLENDSLIFTLQISEITNRKIHIENSTITDTVTKKPDQPIRVRLTDTDNRPIAGEPISLVSGNNEIVFADSSTVITDIFGLGQSSLTLGKKAGSTQITASTNGGEIKETATIIAMPDAPALLAIKDGNNQEELINSALPEPLEVIVFDKHTNPIPEVLIKYQNQTDNGILSDTLAITNSLGIAQTTYQFGNMAGSYHIQASIENSEIPQVTFNLKALPGEAHELAKFSGDNQHGISEHDLNQPLKVQVLDQFRNGVPNLEVSFVTLPNQGSIKPSSQIKSDSLGICTAFWTLGKQGGTQSIIATADGLVNNPLVFTAQISANTPPTISVALDTFTVYENETLDFTIDLTDAQNDTTVLINSPLPDGAVVFFDSTFHFSWTPNFTQAGLYSVTINAADNFGAQSEKTIYISVQNVNRPPVISEDSTPIERNLVTVKTSRELLFNILANDADNDPLSYYWYVNNELKSTSNPYNFRSDAFELGATSVLGVVKDYEDADSLEWTFDIIASVELKYFAGKQKPFVGNELTWETSLEKNNLGFYVLRSDSKNGPFQQVSSLVSSENSNYKFIDNEMDVSRAYFYAIEDLQTDGSRHRHETIKIEPTLPTKYSLQQNYPNPFNSSTIIRFELPEQTFVSITVYDVLGRTVKTLVHKITKPGYHSIKWDGTNNLDLPTASGVYHLLFQTPSKRFSKKIMYLK